MLDDNTLHDLLAYADHGRSSPCLVARDTYRALLRECLAARPVVAAARHAVTCPVPGATRAMELLAHEVEVFDAERVGVGA